jgi:hypothetical protein
MSQRILKYIFTIGILLLSFFFNFTYGQSNTLHKNPQNKSTQTHKFKATFLMGVGVLSTANHSGEIDVSIPYQTINSSGITSSYVFTGKNAHILSNQSPQLLFGIDMRKPSYVINFNAECTTAYNSSNIYIGYGPNIHLGKVQGKTMERKIKTCTWLLRPSLSLSYFSFFSGSFGSITNTNTTIDILGTVAKPTYNHHSSTSTSQYGITADNLVLSYRQNEFGILPKIVLCINPYKQMFTMQVFASYFIPITQTGAILLVQKSNSSKYDSILGGSNIKNHPEAIATYNNKQFQSTPFRLNAITIGIVLGINL